jgi:hypothetical protein
VCQTEFEFSFKFYQSKVWSGFVDVVGISTVKPTNFGLHFSDVSMSFYDFCKLLDLIGKKLR